MKMKIEEIKERLARTTPGKWTARRIPYEGQEDPWVGTEDGTYICQTVYDMQSETQKHNVDADTEFIAHAKEDIDFLLRLCDSYLSRIKKYAHERYQDMKYDYHRGINDIELRDNIIDFIERHEKQGVDPGELEDKIERIIKIVKGRCEDDIQGI